MSNLLFRKVNQKLLEADKVLLIGHKGPDLDACGSVLVLRNYLTSLGKRTEIFFPDAPPSQYEFLPHFNDLEIRPEFLQDDWDLVLILDSGSPDYAGLEDHWINNFFVINIDHHKTNTGFGNINLVNEKASSVCEMVFDFLKTTDFYVDRKIATCLLSGILSDTGALSNAGTTSEAINAVSDLVRCGARIDQVVDFIFRNGNEIRKR